jgi:hypothetical protein
MNVPLTRNYECSLIQEERLRMKQRELELAEQALQERVDKVCLNIDIYVYVCMCVCVCVCVYI